MWYGVCGQPLGAYDWQAKRRSSSKWQKDFSVNKILLCIHTYRNRRMGAKLRYSGMPLCPIRCILHMQPMCAWNDATFAIGGALLTRCTALQESISNLRLQQKKLHLAVIMNSSAYSTEEWKIFECLNERPSLFTCSLQFQMEPVLALRPIKIFENTMFCQSFYRPELFHIWLQIQTSNSWHLEGFYSIDNPKVEHNHKRTFYGFFDTTYWNPFLYDTPK